MLCTKIRVDFKNRGAMSIKGIVSDFNNIFLLFHVKTQDVHRSMSWIFKIFVVVDNDEI